LCSVVQRSQRRNKLRNTGRDRPSLMRANHNTLSHVAAPFLAFMALTGGIWCVCRRWLGFEKEAVKWMLIWHQGDVFGTDPTGVYIRAPYTLALGLCVMYMAISGLSMLDSAAMAKRRKVAGWTARTVHQAVATVAVAPLVLLAFTGATWAVCRYWVGMEKQTVRFLLIWHQGILESAKAYFPPVVAVCILALVSSGLPMNAFGRALRALTGSSKRD
jgi:hypothetical protein